MDKKHAKNALFKSIITLLLCSALFIGSTYAWFAEQVSSGYNEIITGNLDIELQYITSEELIDSVDSIEEGSWQVVDSTKKLFSENWTPGKSEYVYLRVKNNGNLAAKYSLNIRVFDVIEGMNVNHEAYSLDDHIYGAVAKYSDEEQDIEEILNPDDAKAISDPTWCENNSTVMHGMLPPATGSNAEPAISTPIIIALHVPEGTGNEMNYLDEDGIPHKSTFKMGVVLLATQATYETDSFENTYDSAAELPTVWDGKSAALDKLKIENDTVYVSSAAELAAAFEFANLDNIGYDTISLNGDIDLYYVPWGPYEITVPLKIYGNGHHILNLALASAKDSHAGLISYYSGSSLRIEDLTITPVTLASDSNTAKIDETNAFVGHAGKESSVTLEGCSVGKLLTEEEDTED